jgi:hypothetical protein
LAGIAKTQFPFLMQVSESSSESLIGSTYQRRSSVSLDRVQWRGLEEDTTKGSPYFEVKDIDGKETVTAYRLVRWLTSDIAHERERMSKESEVQNAQANQYGTSIGKKNVPTGSLLITTTPPGATILLNGEFIGKSNANFKTVGAGEYQLALQADGYEPVEKSFVVGAGVENAQHFSLSKTVGHLEVETDPPGAIVFIDNYPLPTRAPVGIDRVHGDYTIRVEAPGFHPTSKTVTISYSPIKETLVLNPKPGRLSVITSPDGAEVYANEQPIGKSNLLDRVMPGGNYEITVKREGFLDQTKSTEINEIRGQTIIFKLESNGTKYNPSISVDPKAVPPIETPKKYDRKSWRNHGIASVAYGLLGVGSFAASRVAKRKASDSYRNYRRAETVEETGRYRKETSTHDEETRNLGWLAAGLIGMSTYHGVFFFSGPDVVFQTEGSLGVHSDSDKQNPLIQLSYSRSLP